MSPIDMGDWLTSIPGDPSHPPRPQKLHDVTFPELHEIALEHAKAAYEALPQSTSLHFESVDKATLALLSKNANITNSRLLLGLDKQDPMCPSTAAYAYISTKNQTHQVLLRSGNKHLKAKDFDDFDWNEPFDLIYDAYGQTERAGDKISMMAAFYFLESGRISEITTPAGGFLRNFIKTCKDVYVPPRTSVNSQKVRSGDDDSDGREETSMELQTDELLRWQGPRYVVDYNGRDLVPPCTQPVEANSQIDSEGNRSGIPVVGDSLSRVSSPTAWNGSNRLGQKKPEQLIDVSEPCQEKHELKKPNSEETDQQVKFQNEKKVLDIDDLAAFVTSFKALQAAHAQLQEQNAAAHNLQAVADQAQSDSKQALSQLHALRKQHQTQQSEMHELRKELARTKTDSETNKKLLYELGQEQWKLKVAQQAQIELTKKLDAVQAEKQHFEQRLMDAQQDATSKQKLATIKAKAMSLEADKKNMGERIAILERVVREENEKFNEYKRKIRNLSMSAD